MKPLTIAGLAIAAAVGGIALALKQGWIKVPEMPDLDLSPPAPKAGH